MNENDTYQKMCNKITSDLLKYSKIKISTFNQYYNLYTSFVNDAKILQQEYNEFNKTVIRKNYIKNPIKKGTMIYFEEIISESWYTLIHIPNIESIVRDLFKNKINFDCLFSLEKKILYYYNTNLCGIKIYSTYITILKEISPFSILDIDKILENNTNDNILVQLFWEISVEYNKMTDIIKCNLFDSNFNLINSYQNFIDKYDIEKLHNDSILGYNDFLNIKYSNDNDFIKVYSELKKFKSPFQIKIINKFMIKKLYNYELTLAQHIINDKIEYNDLVQFLSNEELFINELIKLIKKKSLIKEKMEFNNLPLIVNKQYSKLKYDFEQNSEHYNDILFVFNDIVDYKVDNYLVPEQLKLIEDSYELEYKKNFPTRKLKWIYDKSFLTLNYLDYEIECNFTIFLILNLFNNNEILTIDMIHNLTGISVLEINNIIKYLNNLNIIVNFENNIKLNILNKKEKILFLDSNTVESTVQDKEYLILLQDKIKSEIVRYVKRESPVELNYFSDKYDNSNSILESLENQGYIEIKDKKVIYCP